MKRITAFVIILIALTACTAPQAQADMPNPASVYCVQHGNKLEIHTAADGSQNGICILADGSTCDEWAYFRGECGSVSQEKPTPTKTVLPTTKASVDAPKEPASDGNVPLGTSEEISNCWGVIKRTQPGAQFDDYFERQDLGQIIFFGIDSLNPEVSSQIKALRDSGKVVHLYGRLLSNVPDYNGAQIQVDRIEVD